MGVDSDITHPQGYDDTPVFGGEAVGDLNAAIAAIAEFSDAVVLIEAAVLTIDSHVETAKTDIDDHVTNVAKPKIDGFVAAAKAELDRHANSLKAGLAAILGTYRPSTANANVQPLPGRPGIRPDGV